jgi:hypothetical protein
VIESVTAERAGNGRPVVAVRVHNSGGRALDLGGELRLRGGDAELFRLLVVDLKRRVPAFARRYDSNERCWRVKAEAVSDLEGWLNAARGRYNVEVVWEPPDDGVW